MVRPRLLVGQFWQETNSFNPRQTEAGDFVVERGAAMIAANMEAGSPLGGILRQAVKAGAEIVPTLAARAPPGGPVAHAFFQEILAEMVESARTARPQAVCLDLHGAMQTTEVDDSEALILDGLRQAIGPDVPIAVAFDLHAHMTPEKVALADFPFGYRTNPHEDMPETGSRAVSAVLAAAAGASFTVRALATVPLLLLGSDETAAEPLLSLNNRREALETAHRSQIVDISIFNVQPLLDVPDLGQAIVVTADSEAGLAARLAEDLAEALWAARDGFTQHRPSIDETLARAGAGGGVLVLGDFGDRVLGGAPGDSPSILSTALRNHPHLRGFVPVYDPRSVARAWEAGVGATLDLDIGGSVTPGSTPLQVKARVLALREGPIANRGSYMTGVPVDLGATALVAVGQLTILLTGKAPQVQDPAVLAAFGLDPADFDFIVAKSGYHFKLGFEGIGTCVSVDSPGLSSLTPETLAFRRAGPVHPIHEITAFRPRAAIFDTRGRTAGSSRRHRAPA